MATHSLVVALFDSDGAAAEAARLLRAGGVARERVSIIARTLTLEGQLAEAAGATPGSEIEESAAAARVGELGAHLIAAIATVLPGIGPIVADGPLAVDLGEAAGHLAGGVGKALTHAGLDAQRARNWEAAIAGGAVLVGAHVADAGVSAAVEVMAGQQATDVATVAWPGAL